MECSADEPDVIDPVVLIEALVLDRDRRVLDVLRHLGAGEDGPVLVAGDDAEHMSVPVVDRRVLPEGLDVEMRRLARDLLDLGVEREATCHQQRDDHAKSGEQDGAPAAGAAALAPPVQARMLLLPVRLHADGTRLRMSQRR